MRADQRRVVVGDERGREVGVGRSGKVCRWSRVEAVCREGTASGGSSQVSNCPGKSFVRPWDGMSWLRAVVASRCGAERDGLCRRFAVFSCVRKSRAGRLAARGVELSYGLGCVVWTCHLECAVRNGFVGERRSGTGCRLWRSGVECRLVRNGSVCRFRGS